MKEINEPSPSYRVGTYLVDGQAREVVHDNVRIPLTRSEFAMFYQLVQNQGGTVPREELGPWKGKTYLGRHPAEDARKEINKKLGHKIIETVRGVGYRIPPTLGIEVIPSPSATELQQLLVVALGQMDTHSYAGFKAAMENCEQLIAAGRVPDAYCAKALAHINLGMVGFCRELPEVSIDAARDMIKRALKWYPELGSAYALRGLTYLIHEYDWTRAEGDLRASLRFDPNNDFGHSFLSHLLVARRRFDEALDHARRAVKADYKQPVICITEPWFMLFAGDIGGAFNKGKEVVKHFSNSAPVHSIFGHICLAAHQPKMALEHYALALKFDFLPDVVASQGFIHAQEGRREEAFQCLERLRDELRNGGIAYVSGWHEALVYAGLRENEMALDALERAFQERADWLIHLDIDPRWKGLRSDPRFEDLVRRLGIR
jgi:tetratricopeptide (TPR) repeat protein